jgi:hypothetical protein
MYYPKSQIKINLFTKGNQLREISSQKEYIGYYWKTSKGEYFTGRNPNDGVSVSLELIPERGKESFSAITLSEGNDVYNNFKGINISQTLIIPSYQKSSPTQQDYEIGNFKRYFVKKINENIYTEISKDTFNKLRNNDPNYASFLYKIFNIVWTIKGDKDLVSQTNEKIVFTTERNLRIVGLKSYLNNNYLEFYK